MKRSRAFRLGLAVVLISLPAWAVKVGETLYIRSKDTALLKTAAATGAPVAKLQPGTEVIWNGADAKNKQFHKVKAGPKEGFVLQVNLTTNKPQTEVGSDGKGIDGHALAASGAATRTLSEVGQTQAAKTPDLTTAGKQVVLLELINAKVTDKDLIDFAAKQGLPKAGGK